MSDTLLDKRLVAASFSRAAGRYDAYAGLQRTVANRLLASVDRHRPVRRILDLGSGTGYSSESLLALFPDVQLISLDIAPGMLSHARQNRRSAPGQSHYICADAESLPLADNSIDLIFSSLAIQWCSDYEGLFREVCRVARAGSQCVFSTFDEGTLEELRQAWAAVDSAVHVNRFEPAATLRAALARPDVQHLDSRVELIQQHYPDLKALATELKAIGANNRNAGQPRGLTGRQRLAQLEQSFMAGADSRGRMVSWVLHYLAFRVAEP